MRKKIVAGNWKMNNTLEEGVVLVDEIIRQLSLYSSNDVLKIVAPPFIHLAEISRKINKIHNLELGAQNCHEATNGAYTGEVSAKMISSTGATYVIIGHSERRQYFSESNELLAKKVNAVLSANLIPIFCVGEVVSERNNNQHFSVIKQQLETGLFHLSETEIKKVIIAYEPVWAIGTGNTATAAQAQEMHAFIRKELDVKYGNKVSETISLLYGGSCNAQNAKELFACKDVDGGLIGGASLKAADFVQIANSF